MFVASLEPEIQSAIIATPSHHYNVFGANESLSVVKSLLCFIRRTCLNVSLYPMPTAAILQYLNLLGYATLHFRKRIDVLVVFPLATYCPNKLRQISNNYTLFCRKKKKWRPLAPSKVHDDVIFLS